MNSILKQDWYAMCGKEWRGIKDIIRLVSNRDFRYIAVGRLSVECKNKAFKFLLRAIRHFMAVNRGTEINFQNIGAGFTISHCYAITIHANAKVGECVSLRKGVTIGTELRGNRKGTPIIKDRVWIGPNASIVGHITIGNDVLIAPNAFVNFDVPDHSVVIGNPAKIYNRNPATEGYIVYF